jgi:C_GCAxxG_C_C family probable redox protein
LKRSVRAGVLASRKMAECDNCAESVVQAVLEVLEVPVSPEVLETTRFLREGMGSGCACGALVGAVMVSGILAARKPHPLGENLPKLIVKHFRESFGASCCAVIKSKRPLLQRFSRKPCVDLTVATAAWVAELWEEVFYPGPASPPGLEIPEKGSVA